MPRVTRGWMARTAPIRMRGRVSLEPMFVIGIIAVRSFIGAYSCAC